MGGRGRECIFPVFFGFRVIEESVEECLATEEYFIENSIEGKLRLDR